ncbi:MAG: hypothetical protein KBG84_13075 [Planctomycetes bacterium]|nr:hypothetical protein [Planctomycetota bacterium]
MRSTNYAWLLILLLAQVLPACCVWDRDTLSSEAKGQDAVADAISGKSDRYPPKFYEMRLERLKELLRTTPFDLGLYDDCAAALSRLGRFDDALAMLDQKKDVMGRFKAGEGPKNSRYREDKAFDEQVRRRLVNEASIRLHRWIGAGASRQSIEDLNLAKALIVEARTLNADFSSERYLQFVAEWLIAGARAERDALLPDALGLRFKNKTARGVNDELKDAGLADCLDGLAGLIRSSEMWECVDVYYWLSLAYAVDGKQSLSYMARLRAYELIDAGKGSLVPGAPLGNELKQCIVPRMFEAGRRIEAKTLSEQARAEIEEEFGRRRRFAQRLMETRWEFMASKFEYGSHPDVDTRFWIGYEPPSMLKYDLPGDTIPLPEPLPATNVPAAALEMKSAPPTGPQEDALVRGTVMFVMVGAGTVLLVSLGLWVVMKRRPAP